MQDLKVRVSFLDKCVKRIEEEIAYVTAQESNASAGLDLTCQKLALYAVPDEYQPYVKDIKFPNIPKLKVMDKSLLRDKTIGQAVPLDARNARKRSRSSEVETVEEVPPTVKAPLSGRSSRRAKKDDEEEKDNEEGEEGDEEDDEKEEETGPPARRRKANAPAPAAAPTPVAKSVAKKTTVAAKKAASAPAPRRSSRR